MMFYTAAINGVFAFLTAGALVLTRDGVTPEFLLNLLFYIIITPIISVTLTRIMFQSENAMIVADAPAAHRQRAGPCRRWRRPARRSTPGTLRWRFPTCASTMRAAAT